MTNPTENARWLNMLFEVTALPAVLLFIFATILAFALIGVGRVLKRRKQPRSPE